MGQLAKRFKNPIKWVFPPYLNLCPDHVISTGCEMMNLMLNFKYLNIVIFFTRQVLKFGTPLRYFKGALTEKQ